MALWTAIKQAVEEKEAVDCFRSGPRTRAIIRAMKHIGAAAGTLARVIKENGPLHS